MIAFTNLDDKAPYQIFKRFYKDAVSNNQHNIEALTISSFNTTKVEVDSRLVNLKYIDGDKWIFFTNYNSSKSNDFVTHNQISALFFWNNINVQIRMKGHIYKCSKDLSDKHFQKRNNEKNALSISSNQSKATSSYADVVRKYHKTLDNKDLLLKRPEYWGGYFFTPYLFEFWEGHQSRLNKRNVYIKNDSDWQHSILQP